MITLSFDKVDNFVARLQRKGVKVRWEGWNMIFFKELDNPDLRNRSLRRLGVEWGLETVVSPDATGKWQVPNRLVRGANG